MLRLIIVQGLTSSGQTTLAQKLAHYFNWPLESAGDISRKYCREQGIDLPTTPDLEFHRQLENQIKNIITTSSKKLILASRTGAYHAYKFKREYPARVAEIFSILVISPDKVRVQRLTKRKNQTMEQAQKRIKERDSIDLNTYYQLYQTNPLDPKYHDLVIKNDSNTTPDQLLEQALAKIPKI